MHLKVDEQKDGRTNAPEANPPQTSSKLGHKNEKKTRNVSLWHKCPRPGPSSPPRRYLAKNEVEKRAITLIIIGRFYNKSNLTIFYDYITWVWNMNLIHISIIFKTISEGKHLLKVKKGHNSHNNGLIFFPYWNLTTILWLYTCVLNKNSIH